jgi:hypothetical protein
MHRAAAGLGQDHTENEANENPVHLLSLLGFGNLFLPYSPHQSEISVVFEQIRRTACLFHEVGAPYW